MERAGYSDTPLTKKLGIAPGSVVALVGAPADFDQVLGQLPPGASLRKSGRGRRDLTLAFVGGVHDIERRWNRLALDQAVDDVWLVWAKKASPLHAGVTEDLIREAGLERGFVDFKVAAIDETWSGLRFKRRRSA
jgi:hypothetical protein